MTSSATSISFCGKRAPAVDDRKATADPLSSAVADSSDGMKKGRTFLIRARGTETTLGGRYAMKTHVGVDLHQRFCYLTAVDASGKIFKQGQVVNEGAALRAWLRQLPGPRQVVVEASGFWPAFSRAVAPELERLVMVHPQRVKAIASARLKNDRVDSATLAHLSRCDLLPEAWMADEATQQLRLLVRLRITLGRHRARGQEPAAGGSAPGRIQEACHGRVWQARAGLACRVGVESGGAGGGGYVASGG